MSIVRVGLAETKKFADGYDAIFGKKKAASDKPAAGAGKGATKKGAGKAPAAAKKPAARKAARKKS